MRPEKQKIEINFQGGLDSKTDPKQVQAGKFLTLKNSVFNQIGLLKKRNGYELLPTTIVSPNSYSFQTFGANVTAGKHVSQFNDELVILDGLNAYGFSNALSSWIYRGRLETCSISSDSVIKDSHNHVSADCAINETTGLSLYAWEKIDGDPVNTAGPFNLYGVQYSLLDNLESSPIINGATVGNAFSVKPRCIAIGNNLYLFYYDGSSAIQVFAVTTAGAGSTTAIIGNIDTTNPNYDIQVIAGNIYIAYNGTGGTVKVASFNSSLTPVANISKSDNAAGGIGLFSDGSNNIWVAYNNGSNTKVFIVNSALGATVLAPTVIDSSANALNTRNVTGIYDGTRGIVFYDKPGVPDISNSLNIVTTANFTQPAVNTSVSVQIANTNNILPYGGQIIYIATGGYYQVSAITGPTTFLAVNLGYVGNAAPAVTISSGAAISTTGTYTNALVTYNTINVGGSVGTPANFIRSCALNSRAFLKNSIAHVVVGHTSFLQPTYFVCALYNISSDATIVKANISAKIAEDTGGGIPYESWLPSVNLLANGTFRMALLRESSLTTYTNNGVVFSYRPCGVTATNIGFDSTAITSRNLGNNLHFGLGALEMYDGGNVVEHGFHIYPENIIAVTSGSGNMGTGLYGYQVTYEWVDNQGQTHRSSPSPNVSVSVTAGQAVLLTIPTLRVTAKQNAVIAIYRTAANGTVYYRINGIRITPNDTTVDSITFADTLADSAIIGDNELYTLGEIENIAAPASNSLQAFKNRIFLIPSEDPYSFWYSKKVIPGSPVEFSDVFVQNVGSIGGPLIGIFLMDDKAILFKETTIYYQIGDGPAASGANNDFTDPIFITSDCGLVDLNSVVVMPQGLMFKSKKGIYLIDRGMNASYIGADVEAYNASSVLSAQLIPKTNEVRFLLNSGVILMYDYYVSQWSVFDTITGISDTIFNDLQHYLDSSGVIHRETPAIYLDGASPVLMSFTTSWMKLSGLQGYQRAYFYYLLGEYLGAAANAFQLSVSTAINYSSTATSTVLVTPINTAINTVLEERIFLQTQRCQSVQITVQEVYTGTPGAAFTFSGINFILGLKSPFRPMPANQSTG